MIGGTTTWPKFPAWKGGPKAQDIIRQGNALGGFWKCLAAFLALPTLTQADSSIIWQGLPSEEANSFLSTNRPLPNGFLFALGGFKSGFTATAGNVAQWSANWTTLDLAEYEAIPYHTFNGVASLADNDAFGAGASAYVWGFDDALDEMILLTNPQWKWPVSASGLVTAGTAWALDNQTAAVMGEYRVFDDQTSRLRTAKSAADVPKAPAERGVDVLGHSLARANGQDYLEITFEVKAGSWKVEASRDLKTWRAVREIAAPGTYSVRDDQPVTANRVGFLRLTQN